MFYVVEINIEYIALCVNKIRQYFRLTGISGRGSKTVLAKLVDTSQFAIWGLYSKWHIKHTVWLGTGTK